MTRGALGGGRREAVTIGATDTADPCRGSHDRSVDGPVGAHYDIGVNPLVSMVEQPAPRLGIADRLREAGRLEFSLLGYHGARVQGISRRAGCNVALLYRHWASKKALYLDVLRTALERIGRDVTERLAERPGPAGVIEAYLDAHMSDPTAATLVVRELLDGGPFAAGAGGASPDARRPAPARGAGALLRPHGRGAGARGRRAADHGGHVHRRDDGAGCVGQRLDARGASGAALPRRGVARPPARPPAQRRRSGGPEVHSPARRARR